MEEEEHIHNQYAQHSTFAVTSSAYEEHAPKTLNEDPFNVRAEELAVEECQKGFIVEKLLNETDMVVTSCGSLIPGTPDGGFKDSNGALTLVQVVRVPLLSEMDADTVGDVLYSTVLAKIVKSQQWMKATSTLPREFIIFCWLPPVGAYQTCLEQSDALLWTESLLWNVRAGGWPFTLRIMVPLDPGGMFPNNFGYNSHRHTQTKVDCYWNGLCYNVNADDFEENGVEDEEPMEWYLFADDFDQVVEGAECEAESSSPAMCMRTLIFLFDQLLENFEHREEAEGAAPIGLILGFGSFVDPMLSEASAKNHPGRKASPSTRDRERPSLPPCIRGLPWLGIDGRWQELHGLPGRFADSIFSYQPEFIKPCGSTSSVAICCVTVC